MGDRIALLGGPDEAMTIWTSDVTERHQALSSSVRSEIEGRITSA